MSVVTPSLTLESSFVNDISHHYEKQRKGTGQPLKARPHRTAAARAIETSGAQPDHGRADTV